MLMDYHLHSDFSGDGRDAIEELCRAAEQKGISHIAITDHHDIGHHQYDMKKMEQYVPAIDRCRALFPGLYVARGMEMDYRTETWERMRHIPEELGLDFALLSLHYVDGLDPYTPEYFEGRTRREAYALYLERLAEMIARTSGPWVLGHITYVAKFAPYKSPGMAYDDYRDELDCVLRRAVEKGYGLEVNASGIANNAGLLPGSDVLRRYRELGGEIVTVGSDAHSAANVGRWTEQALAAVREAGFRHVAAFRELKPRFIPID